MAKLQPYIVEIEEHYHRGVIVWAESEAQAEEAANNLHESGDIDLSRNCYTGSETNVTGRAKKEDLYIYTQFWAC